MLPTGRGTPITVIDTEAIRATFDDQTLQQAVNSRLAPGVTDVVLNPDAHVGYGAPIGCVMVSPSHIYPGPVGVDISHCGSRGLGYNLASGQFRSLQQKIETWGIPRTRPRRRTRILRRCSARSPSLDWPAKWHGCKQSS